jgi:predicted outer membrane repeat protein
VLEDRLAPALLTVTTLQDTGVGSLRGEIAVAAPGDTINFPVTGTIPLTSGPIAIMQNVTINGPGPGVLSISGSHASRIFDISNANVSISDLTLTQGKTVGNSGGAIASTNANLTLTRCVLSGNQAVSANGGAIAYIGGNTQTITDCTFTGNTADGNGGAIDSPGITLNASGSTFDHNTTNNTDGGGALSIGAGTVALTNCTFTANAADSGHGGAINSNFAATFTLVNCTVAGNSANTGGGISSVAGTTLSLANTIVASNNAASGPDVSGTIVSQDYNLIQNPSGATINGTITHSITGVNPLLGPLADNGGPTETMALTLGSPAIDAAGLNGPSADQRGVARPQGSAFDIGAYEADRNVFVVTNTNSSGSGSLAQAIIDANSTALFQGNPNVIQFNIPGSGVQVIQPTTVLPAITQSVFIDGYSQPGAAPNTLTAGDNAVLTVRIDGANLPAGSNGLVLNAGGSAVRGLDLTGFQQSAAGGGNAIEVLANGDTIAGNFIGLLPDGTTAAGNGGDGVLIVAASNNVVGGTTPADRNIISGNAGSGVDVLFPGATGNLIQGNFIGTNASGTGALGNASGFFAAGVNIDNEASNNTVGGGTAGAGNVISGNNGFGIHLFGFGTSGNKVQGNRIGTDVTGTAKVGNTSGGVEIDNSASGNFLGTDGDGVNDAAEGNLISGNQGEGVEVGFNGAADGNVIAGNFIGTDVTGTAALGNQLDGITIGNATNTRVGTNADGVSDTLERNVISGNGQFGVSILDVGATGNVVAGNFIGTDVNGTTAIANQVGGVNISQGAANNTVGGTLTADRNVISGNLGTGVDISGSGTTGNGVEGNYVGTSAAGTAALGNGGNGVGIDSAASNNTVGGTATGASNVISGNALNGVAMNGTGTTVNVVAGNFIGADNSGTIGVGNGQAGVFVGFGASGNTVGGTATRAGNVISANSGDGVELSHKQAYPDCC